LIAGVQRGAEKQNRREAADDLGEIIGFIRAERAM
jgi:hypothetical protein